MLAHINGFNCYFFTPKNTKEESTIYLCPKDKIDLVKIKSKRKLVCPDCGQQFNKKDPLRAKEQLGGHF